MSQQTLIIDKTNFNNNFYDLPHHHQSHPSHLHSGLSFGYSDLKTVELVKFYSLLLALFLVPLISLLKLLPKSIHHPSRLNRLGRPKRKLPVNYEPPQSTVDAPFIPLPTRRHFRVSHIGNRIKTRKSKPLTQSINQFDSDSENEDSDSQSESIRVEELRLVFGRRLRGEEEEFKGPSAMKGSRSLHSNLNSSLSNHLSKPTSQVIGFGKSISFNPVNYYHPHHKTKLTTQIDSTINFWASNTCQLKSLN
ncbi:hypothetical protein O181_054170 [Austropuccinia psidii MF-1]|uniref:Uncharacterized protein n=1 Tax=Austropuccinia psidii MF-1 TaxID=1389203 RepID=A0A9Q3E1Y3_9BASI|nr:hypothetical protein [Austropuccinia psidii MF-1]